MMRLGQIEMVLARAFLGAIVTRGLDLQVNKIGKTSFVWRSHTKKVPSFYPKVRLWLKVGAKVRSVRKLGSQPTPPHGPPVALA